MYELLCQTAPFVIYVSLMPSRLHYRIYVGPTINVLREPHYQYSHMTKVLFVRAISYCDLRVSHTIGYNLLVAFCAVAGH